MLQIPRPWRKPASLAGREKLPRSLWCCEWLKGISRGAEVHSRWGRAEGQILEIPNPIPFAKLGSSARAGPEHLSGSEPKAPQ